MASNADAAREERERTFIALAPLVLAVLVPLGLGWFVWASLHDAHERDLLASLLQRPARECRVTVDGREVPDASSVLEALRTVAPTHAHHSSPTAPVRIAISTATATLDVIVARDSQYHDEYWVFLPERRTLGDGPFGREIGRIKTSAFDSLEESQR